MSDAISPREFCETVYCGIAPRDAFILTPDGSIDLVVHVTDHTQSSAHHVRFTSVSRYQSRGGAGAPQPGDLFEFSVIELEREVDGWRVYLNPWYVEEIEFRARQLWLDEQEVVGDGRWFQDDLPAARPA